MIFLTKIINQLTIFIFIKNLLKSMEQTFLIAFNQVDDDHDSYLDANQFEQLLIKLQTPLYIGQIKKFIQIINEMNNSTNSKIDYNNALLIYQYNYNNIKYLYQGIFEFFHWAYKFLNTEENQKQQIAPSPIVEQIKPVTMNVNLKVGQEQDYTNSIKLSFQKFSKEAQINQLKIKLYPKEGKSDTLIQQINIFYDGFKEVVNNDIPELKYIVDRLKLKITKEDQNILVIELIQNCPQLNHFLKSIISTFQKITKESIQAKLDLNIQSKTSFKQTLENDQQTFYHLLSNFKVNLSLFGSKQVQKILKLFGKKQVFSGITSDLKNKNINQSFFFLLTACLENLDINLEFKNSPFIAKQQQSQQHIEIKKQFINEIKQIYNVVPNQLQFLHQLLQSLSVNVQKGFQIELNLHNIRLNLKVHLNDLWSLYQKIISQ